MNAWRYRIYGPPGCGKTTWLQTQVKQALGADKDARDRNGNTPLDLAKSWEQVGNIETLEKLGATRGSV